MKKIIPGFLYGFNTMLFVFYTTISFGQSIDSAVARYAAHFPQERAYIHYDKSSYYGGETIWFKAYLMSGIFPADESKTFYIDWIADNGEVLSHSVSPIVDATTNGQFDIPATYNGNFVHVRAYTKWMLNFDTGLIYRKDIRIIAKGSTQKNSRPAVAATISFFPEGGDVITGIVNKIAFKVTDQWGNPVKIRGVIQNSKGQVVDSLKARHDGMGYFNLIPELAANYIAKWKDEKGLDHVSPLPPARASGISMQVSIAGTKRYIKLNGNPGNDENLRNLHVVGTMSQNIVFRTDVQFEAEGTFQKIVPTQNLPSGILVITVFDAVWNAIAERITFINNGEYAFQPTMEVQHWGLNKRARNVVQINLPDSVSAATMSVSVTDAAIETDTSDNIISHLLLSSELKGEIYHPAYYLSNKSDTTAQNLDLVMLTHGWRRFKWEDAMKGKKPVVTYPRDTSYLALSGKVFGVSKTQLNGTDNIILIIKGQDSSTKMMVMPIDRNANFGDPSMVFFDTLHVYYHLKSKFFGNAEAKFMTDRLPPENYQRVSKFFNHGEYLNSDTAGFYRHGLLAAEALRLSAFNKGKILDVVTVTAKKKTVVQMLDEKYTSGLFKNGDGYQFDLVNDATSNAYPNIFTYLQGKVAGLQINATSNPPSLSWRGATPDIFLDDVHSDADMLTSIPVGDIAYVKVFRPPFFGSSGGGSGGAIAIYTRRGSDMQAKPGGGMTANTIAGYTPIRQFYSPNYSSFDPKNEQPDSRTTLFWNPSLATSAKNHSVSFTFYNNDVTKSFRVILEGMSREGLLTHFEQIME